MKTKILIAVLFTIVITCVCVNQSFSQTIQQNSGTGNYWESLDFVHANPSQAIGVGSFLGPGVLPQAALHVDTRNVTIPFYGASEVFRTDCPGIGSPTYWRMWFGGSECGNLSTGGAHFTISASHSGGNLYFQTSGANTRMTILGTTNPGYVGIGTTNPASLLDVGLAGTTLGTFRLEGSTSGYVQIQPAVAAGSWTMTLPTTSGSAGQVLQTNGSGVTSWGYAGGGMFNTCTTGATAITDDVGINMGNHNVYFSDPSSITGYNSVGIGYTCSHAPLFGKLDIIRENNNLTSTTIVDLPSGLNVTNLDKGLRVGIYNNYSETHGISSCAIGENAGNTGGFFLATNAINWGHANQASGRNIGFFSNAFPATNHSDNYGIYSKALSWGEPYIPNGLMWQNNIAVCGYANGYHPADHTNHTINYAIEGIAYSPNMGIYPHLSGNENWAGYFLGAVFTSQSQYATSDSIFKINVDTIPNALNTILALKPHTYLFDTVSYPYMSFPGNLQYGLIAQEVESIIPDLVIGVTQAEQDDSAGNRIIDSLEFRSLNYTGFIPIIIRAMQEQEEIIDTIQTKFGKIGAINGCWIDTGKVEWGTSPLLHNTT
ncbi:MAG: tail fiber domain-containing protein, partial [Bacteroidota bacterium]